MFCIDEFVGEKKKNVHSMLRNLFIELLLGVVYCACKFLTKRYSAQDYFRTKERNDHTTNAQRSRGGGVLSLPMSSINIWEIFGKFLV